MKPPWIDQICTDTDLCDINEDERALFVDNNASKLASVIGMVLGSMSDEIATRTDVDAVLMLATSWYGALPILAACDAGKAIYCASTLDIDLQQAQEVKDRVEKSGIAFMAEFPRRHAPACGGHVAGKGATRDFV